MIRFALTIFLSAFLLFQVQPLIGKYILPWFGGTSGVWTTCLLFFQCVLLAGYAYAHFLGRLTWKRQATIHLVLLAAALVFLPITPSEYWKPKDGHAPTMGILMLLTATIGLPYLVLSSTGPLLQNWFSITYPGRSPYRLYSLSNVGSLLALVTFPIFIETNLSRKWQVGSWSIAFLAFVACCAWCAIELMRRKDAGNRAGDAPTALPLREGQGEGRASKSGGASKAGDATLPKREGSQTAAATSHAPRPSIFLMLMWLLLSASGSAILMATTNQLTADVAVVPFLWVIPLALYLISFIICFDNERWYRRTIFGSMMLIFVPLAIALLKVGVEAPLWLQIAGYSGCLFACCMCCHGELVRSKPDPKHLTLFYLTISAGGAVGGLCVAVLAPLMLDDYFEFHYAVFAAAAMTCLAWLRTGMTLPLTGPIPLWRYVTAAAVVVVAAIVFACAIEADTSLSISYWPWKSKVVKAEDLGPQDMSPAEWAAVEEGAVNLKDMKDRVTPAPIPFLIEVWDVIKAQSKTAVGGMLGVIGLIILAALGDRLRSSWGDRPAFGYAAMSVGLLALAGILYKVAGETRKLHTDTEGRKTVLAFASRNFYGVLHVKLESVLSPDHKKYDPDWDGLGERYKLVHGRIMHGFQWINGPARYWHTSYYASDSGVGYAIEQHPRRLDNDPENPKDPKDKTLHIGFIGLGTGTTASYARKGDRIRIYEINPAVDEMSGVEGKWFTYVKDAAADAEIKVVLGDARVMLEHERDRGEIQKFDVLAVDAFSSDAIPIHLLTKECAELYFDHLNEDGILALHISNRFINLTPVTDKLATEFGRKRLYITNSTDTYAGVSGSSWVLITKNKEFLANREVMDATQQWRFEEKVKAEHVDAMRHTLGKPELKVGQDNPKWKKPVLWTDDFASLWELLEF